MKNKNLSLKIGKRISEARCNLGYNQATLAKKLGVTAAAISQIEAGKRIPSTTKLKELASVLRISVDYLLFNSKHVKLYNMLHDKEFFKLCTDFSLLSDVKKEVIYKQMEFIKQGCK